MNYKTKRFLALLLSLMLMLTLVVACGTTNEDDSVETTDKATDETVAPVEGIDPNRIIRMSGSGTPILDPAAGITKSCVQTLINVYDTLIYPGEDGVEPLIAKSWAPSEDGLSYTFELNEGIKFHDGSELLASDVVYSFNRLMDIGEGYSYLFDGIVKDVVADDDHTVTFHLEKPTGPFVNMLVRLFIVNEDLVKENTLSDGPYGENGDYGTAWLRNNDAGSGPYMVKEFVQQDHVYCEYYPDWFVGWEEDAPQGFQLIDNTEPTTIRTMIANKELEITDQWQTAENLDAMSQFPGVEIASSSAMLSQYIYMHNRLAPTDDVNYRKALSCLVDYQMVIDVVFPGSQISKGPVNQYTLGHVDTTQYSFDIERAKEYLADSAYADTYQDMEIEFLLMTDVAALERIALSFQANCAEVGIPVTITKVPWVTVVERLSAEESTPHLVCINAAPAYNEAGSSLESRYHSKTTGTYENGEWILDPELDARIEDAISTVDETERFEKYAEIQNYLADELVPTIWLCDLADRVAYQEAYVSWPVHDVNKEGKLPNNINGYMFYLPGMKIFPDKK